jgi:mycofactocin system transcriptional regulator
VSNPAPDSAAACPRPRPGRPRTTSREEIGSVALALFAQRRFEHTTLDDIAAAVGISRRTILRYYASKNDIVWGTFGEHLAGLRARLAAADPSEPMLDTLRRAVVEFNDYGPEQQQDLRLRMTLITTVPALEGHSMVRYAEWSDVIAEFVARRLAVAVDEQLPQLIAAVALGAAMATYRHWIRHPDADLLAELDRAFSLLATGFPESKLQRLSARPPGLGGSLALDAGPAGSYPELNLGWKSGTEERVDADACGSA